MSEQEVFVLYYFCKLTRTRGNLILLEKLTWQKDLIAYANRMVANGIRLVIYHGPCLF